MKAPSVPGNELERLSALNALGLLDTPPEERLDRLTWLAQQFFGADIVLITLVDKDRQWFKSRQGLNINQTSRSISICGYTILENGIFEVPDAREDSRFFDNPLVTESPHLRFYAGVPLASTDGLPIGTFCIISTASRKLTAEERTALWKFAACVQEEIHATDRQQLRTELAISESRSQAILDAMPDRVFVVDHAGTVLSCQDNQALAVSRDAMPAPKLPQVMPAALAEKYRDAVALTLEKDEPVVLEYEDGHPAATVQFEARFKRLNDTEVLILVRDVTQERASEIRARELFDQLKKLTSNLPGMIYQYQLGPDGHASLPYTSEGITSVYGMSSAGLDEDASPLLNRIHPQDKTRILDSIKSSAERLAPWEERFRLVQPGGADIWVEGRATPERLDNGATRWHGFLANINEHKRLEQVQQKQAVRTRVILDNVVDGIITVDQAGVVVSVNPAAQQMFGYSQDEAVGREVKALMPSLYQTVSKEQVLAYQKGQMSRRLGVSSEVEATRRDGQTFPMDLTVSRVAYETETLYIGVMRDASQRKSAETEINNLAFYDPLTSLPNRRLLQDRLEHACSVSRRLMSYGALLFLDLDNFKHLNDTGGHQTGDQLLQLVAKRLMRCVREDDTVARFGGDEFVVLLEALGPDPKSAASYAEKVAEEIRLNLNEPYSQIQPTYQGTPSIGITLFLNNSDPIDQLLRQAEIAMYQAKTAGRNRLIFFDSHMQTAMMAHALIAHELRTALHEQQFELFYQVQVDSDGLATGAEALLRWHHPTKGWVRPNDFIPLAEETGLILPIGQWVLQTACQQLVAWGTQPETEHLTLAVNISALQVAESDFVDQVLAALTQAGASPAMLKLELTESLLASNIDDVIAKMAALREKGVNFSLDDFGTGYSSLAYLKKMPIEQLKIDQSFVRDILVDPNDKVIAKTVIALANSMGLTVIAEGVETEEHRSLLEEMGCYAYQGYLFGRPMPVEDFEQSLGGLNNAYQRI